MRAVIITASIRAVIITALIRASIIRALISALIRALLVQFVGYLAVDKSLNKGLTSAVRGVLGCR